MAHQRASVRGTVVSDRRRLILADNRDVKIDEPLSGDSRAERTEAVRRMAAGAGETIVGNVAGVLRPTGVGNDVVQVVALCAERAKLSLSMLNWVIYPKCDGNSRKKLMKN